MSIKRYLFKREALSNMTAAVAQVFFAGMFVEELLQTNTRWNVTSIGFILSIEFWIMSLLFAKK